MQPIQPKQPVNRNQLNQSQSNRNQFKKYQFNCTRDTNYYQPNENQSLPPGIAPPPPVANYPTRNSNVNKRNPDTQKPRNINNRPSWMSNLKEFQQENQSKKPRAFVVLACLLEINCTASIQAMPLAVSNGLPAAEFLLVNSNKTKVTHRFHMDSCASINTGNLLVHQWLMKEYLYIFHCY